jgi:hypothetical protein
VGTSILVSEVIEEARVRMNAPAFTASTQITTTAALNLLKFSARRLSSKLRRAYGSDYFTRTGTLTTQADLNSVSLPQDFTDLRQIAWVRDSGPSIPLEVASVDEFLTPGELSQAWAGAPKYRLQGNVVQFFPCPNAVYTLSLYYDTGIFVTAASDTMIIQPGWEEWLINDFCVKVRQSQNKEAGDFIRERAIAEEEILKEASQRDRFQNHTVRDTWGDGDYVDSRSLYWRR